MDWGTPQIRCATIKRQGAFSHYLDGEQQRGENQGAEEQDSHSKSGMGERSLIRGRIVMTCIQS